MLNSANEVSLGILRSYGGTQLSNPTTQVQGVHISTHINRYVYEYLVYQAGAVNKSALIPIRAMHRGRSYTVIMPYPCQAGSDDSEFLLADLSPTSDRGSYLLGIFSSKTNKWVTWPVQLDQAPPIVTTRHPPNKVIVLGGGAVAWIDLWRGILVCDDVLHEEPVLRFIPLPKPGFDPRIVGPPEVVRDVTCCNGFIKLVEMDRCFKQVLVGKDADERSKNTYNFDGEDIIYDSEISFGKDDLMSGIIDYVTIADGWKIRTCYRHVFGAIGVKATLSMLMI